MIKHLHVNYFSKKKTRMICLIIRWQIIGKTIDLCENVENKLSVVVMCSLFFMSKYLLSFFKFCGIFFLSPRKEKQICGES